GRRLAHEVLTQEADSRGEDGELIFHLGDLVTLVLQTDELDGAPERPQAADHLLGFANRDTWIVGSVDDQQWCPDTLDLVDRGDLFEKSAIVLQAAVFHLAQVPPPRTGVLE